jgi:mono/diheme cytochrome c family protein
MFEKSKDTRSRLHLWLPMSLILVLGLVLSACGGAADSGQNSAAPANPVANTAGGNSSEQQAQPTDAAAQPEPTAESAAALSFSADIFPIFQSRCINCHGGERIEGDLVILTYEDLMAGGKDGQVVVPGDAGNSLLVELVTNLKMPKRGPKLTPVQIQAITDWVNQGALNN